MHEYGEKNMKYDAVAVLKLAGKVTPSTCETAGQNHPIWGNL